MAIITVAQDAFKGSWVVVASVVEAFVEEAFVVVASVEEASVEEAFVVEASVVEASGVVMEAKKMVVASKVVTVALQRSSE